MLTTNTTPIIDIAGGNFYTSVDSYEEIAVLYSGGTQIGYCKPTTTWATTTNNTASLTKIAAGNFDGSSSNGDEIAGINASNGLYVFIVRRNNQLRNSRQCEFARVDGHRRRRFR
jgi:hypothetical protein